MLNGQTHLRRDLYCSMDNIDKQVVAGIIGTGVSASAIPLSELSALISIIIAVLGFCISVLIPSIIKLIRTIKKAKADGEITEDEIKDITTQAKDIVDKTTEQVKETVEDIKDIKNK